jgi:hypothetical protein
LVTNKAAFRRTTLFLPQDKTFRKKSFPFIEQYNSRVSGVAFPQSIDRGVRKPRSSGIMKPLTVVLAKKDRSFHGYKRFESFKPSYGVFYQW